MATNKQTPDTEMAEVVEAVKKSILAQVIENNYLRELVSGDIWKRDEEEIKGIEEILEKFRKLVATAFKMHDEELKTRREIHGNDHLKSLEFFRKPREAKGNSNLLAELDM